MTEERQSWVRAHRLATVLTILIGVSTLASVVLQWLGVVDFGKLFAGFASVQEKGPLVIGNSCTMKYGNLPLGPGGFRTGYAPVEGFSLRTGTVTPPDQGDFTIHTPPKPGPGGMTAGYPDQTFVVMNGNGSGICVAESSHYEGCNVAPEYGKQYQPRLELVVGKVYYVSLDDGKSYGKIVFRERDSGDPYGTLSFDYVLQRNGKRELN